MFTCNMIKKLCNKKMIGKKHYPLHCEVSANYLCEDCGKSYCHWHIKPNKHYCGGEKQNG
jgi:predicted nucleic acid binding AN1-type Zn finger protein